MKNKGILGSAALFLILTSSFNLRGQNRENPNFSARLSNGVSVLFKTTTEPKSSFRSISGTIRVNSMSINRVLVDRVERVFFGYDLELEPLNETKQYKVSIKPLDRGFADGVAQSGTMREITGQSGASSTGASLLRFPQPQVVADGDTLVLDLLINRKTGVKLVDEITISSGDVLERSTPTDIRPASDFSLEDVRLSMKNQQLLINGELVAGGPDAPGSCEGKFIFFYLPGRGRFVFSIKPQEGFAFRKIGVIHHNRISFSVGGDSYEWVSTAPILPTGGNWNLWVLHEPNYQPEYGFNPQDRLIKGTAAAGNVRQKNQFFFGAMGSVRALR